MTANDWSDAILRWSMSGVFLWFGFHQIQDPTAWVGYVPNWAVVFGMSKNTLVLMNGWVEIVAGLMLLAGFYIRPVALFLGLHLIVIALSFGGGPNTIRDSGLAIATIAIFLRGADKLSIDAR